MAILGRLSESLQVEVKAWINPSTPEGEAKIAKAILALRNRKGGKLIIGFDDETLSAVPYSFTNGINSLFHSDVIQGIVSRFASELFPVSVEIVIWDGQQHPIISVPSGITSPVVVRRDLKGDGGKWLLREGDIYFRTLRANNTPVALL